MQRILLALIRAYRYLLSPWIGQQCRFTPSCSAYAMQAIDAYGPGRGSWLTLRRLLRCHPLCQGGHDPVPGLDTETAPPDQQDESHHGLEQNDQAHTGKRQDHA